MNIEFEEDFFIPAGRLILKVLDPVYAPQVLDYYRTNLNFFMQYMPPFPEKFLTGEFQTEYLWREYQLRCEDKGIRFYLFGEDDYLLKEIIGDICISHVQRFPFNSCKVSYKLAKHNTGKGYMTEAMNAVLDYIFTKLELQRVEANIMPVNHTSLRLIERLGFSREGISKKYLEIMGKREDHIRFALLREDWLAWHGNNSKKFDADEVI